MKLKQKLFTFLVFILIFSSCKKEEKKADFNRSFNQVFSLIKKESINKNEVDWIKIKRNTTDSIVLFRNNEDAYNGIKYVLNQINDSHGFLKSPTNNFTLNDSLSIPDTKHCIIGKNIGYIKISGFAANDSLCTLYSWRIRNALKDIDEHPNLSGWIIDLRDNFGGKASTFALGIAPLYKDSVIGYSLNNKGEYAIHKILENTYYYGDKIIGKIDSISTSINNDNKRIAILINEKTASLGEFTALSLKFQNNTMLFGTKTRGLTTDILVFQFVSGSILGLSTAHWCDKNKTIINGSIIPDVKCSSEKSLAKAIEWIEN